MSAMIEVSYHGFASVNTLAFEPLAIAVVEFDPPLSVLSCNANFYGYERSLAHFHEFILTNPRHPIWIRIDDNGERVVMNCHIAQFKRNSGPLVSLTFNVVYGPMTAHRE